MNRADIIAKLKSLLQKQQHQLKTEVAGIQEEMSIDQLGFDSISILDFMYDVEAEFSVQTEVADLVKMERVKDLVDYIVARSAA